MAQFSEVFQILESGADVALMAIAFAIYKLERRVLKLETILTVKDI